MTHARADELTVVKLLTADYSPGFIAQANKMLEADVQQIAERYGWPDKEKLGWAVDELTRAADENEQRRMPTRRKDPEAVPATAAKPKVIATATAFGKPAAAEPEPLVDETPPDVDEDDQEPTQDRPVTIEALVFRASGSESKRTQSLGKRITELAAELRERLDAEEAEREEAERRTREQAEAQKALEAARAALAEAEAKARAAGVTKTKAKGATRPVGGGDHDPKTVRAWAAAHGVTCPDRGRVPGHVVDAWRKAYEGARSA